VFSSNWLVKRPHSFSAFAPSRLRLFAEGKCLLRIFLPGVLLFSLLHVSEVPLLAQAAVIADNNQGISSGKKKSGTSAEKAKKKGGSGKKKSDAAAEEEKKKEGAGKKKGSAAGKKKTDPSDAQSQDENTKDSAGLKFKMKDYPSLRFGKALRVDFHAKAQGDFRTFWPERKIEEGVFDLHRARIGVEGRFLKHFEFEIERELRDTFRRFYEDLDEAGRTDNPWRDVYVNFRYFPDFQIKVGKFKLPFGMDQPQGATKLDFIMRSRIGDLLAPARDKGIMAHGRLFERGLSYQAGYFLQDGENARTSDNEHTGGHTLAGRVLVRPLRLIPSPAVTKNIELGMAFTSSNVSEGLKGLRGRTLAKETFFRHMFVNGRRLRVGTEMNWRPGPFSLQGEFIHVQEQRKKQSLLGQDLPDLISRGWYLTGTWAVTGEQKADEIKPRREFLRERGFGALELAARCEQIRFGSSEHPGIPSRGTRAANILGNSDRVWTFGINWYLNRWVKIQANAVRERIEDTARSPIPGRSRFWGRWFRLQFVL
jgi:phosphate-selective porin OprO/OprP